MNPSLANKMQKTETANTSNAIKYSMLSNSDTISKIKIVDEIELNDFLNQADLRAAELKDLIRKKLPPLSKKKISIRAKNAGLRKIPRSLQSIVNNLKLLDESDYDARAKLFFGYCKYRNYSYNTVKTYFAILTNHRFFGDSTLRPNKLNFSDDGKIHTRIVSKNDFLRLMEYARNNCSRYTAPILIAIYSGLRTSEILQFTNYTLYQLKQRQATVTIKRKTILSDEKSESQAAEIKSNDNFWRPIYNTHLNNLTDNLIELFSDEYEALKNHDITVRLFHITPKTVANRIRHLFYLANNHLAPLGFGVHSCRNMLAMFLAETSMNLITIRNFLQHKKLSTTRKYIKADFSHTIKEFNRITNYDLSDVKGNLKPPATMMMEEYVKLKRQS